MGLERARTCWRWTPDPCRRDPGPDTVLRCREVLRANGALGVLLGTVVVATRNLAVVAPLGNPMRTPKRRRGLHDPESTLLPSRLGPDDSP